MSSLLQAFAFAFENLGKPHNPNNGSSHKQVSTSCLADMRVNVCTMGACFRGYIVLGWFQSHFNAKPPKKRSRKAHTSKIPSSPTSPAGGSQDCGDGRMVLDVPAQAGLRRCGEGGVGFESRHVKALWAFRSSKPMGVTQESTTDRETWAWMVFLSVGPI